MTTRSGGGVLAFLLCLLAGACTEGNDPPLGPPGEESNVEDDLSTVDAEAASRAIDPVGQPRPVRGRHRGFNLLGMYKEVWGNNTGYSEDDFALIAELGFNTARLPLDYLTYASREDWLLFHEERLQQIDRGIDLAQRYGVHVLLNLHGAPGYSAHGEADTPVPEEQDLDLWRDREAQDAFVAHWTLFARRYRKIPAEFLSFNLVNEPFGVDEETYLRVMNRAIAAIREVSRDRPIILDGLEGGRVPLALEDDRLQQALHAYDPMNVTHYLAPWSSTGEEAEPTWPPNPLQTGLYGPAQSSNDLDVPLVIEGDFAAGTRVAIKVNVVSGNSTLVITADETEILRHAFEPGEGEGEWEVSEYVEEHGIYQNTYNRVYSAELPVAAERLTFELVQGDWLSFHQIEIGKHVLTPGVPAWSWGVPQTTVRLDASGRLEAVQIPPGYEEYDWRAPFEPWTALEKRGVDVIVGEFGVYNRTPHTVTLAFLDDLLTLFETAGFGWCLWEFSGEFGVLDSNREDVDYESAYGHRVDRKMLELLQAH